MWFWFNPKKYILFLQLPWSPVHSFPCSYLPQTPVQTLWLISFATVKYDLMSIASSPATLCPVTALCQACTATPLTAMTVVVQCRTVFGPYMRRPVETWRHMRRNRISSFSRNERVHLNRPGGRGVSSVDCWQPRCAPSEVVMLDTPCSEVVWRVLATHCFRQFPPSLPLPCVTVCHHISTGVLQTISLDPESLLFIIPLLENSQVLSSTYIPCRVCQSRAQPPPWRTKVYLVVGGITFDMSGMGDLTSSLRYW